MAVSHNFVQIQCAFLLIVFFFNSGSCGPLDISDDHKDTMRKYNITPPAPNDLLAEVGLDRTLVDNILFFGTIALIVLLSFVLVCIVCCVVICFLCYRAGRQQSGRESFGRGKPTPMVAQTQKAEWGKATEHSMELGRGTAHGQKGHHVSFKTPSVIECDGIGKEQQQPMEMPTKQPTKSASDSDESSAGRNAGAANDKEQKGTLSRQMDAQ